MQIGRLLGRDTPGRNPSIAISRVLNQHALLGIGCGLKTSHPMAGFVQATPEPDPATLFSHGCTLANPILESDRKDV